MADRIDRACLWLFAASSALIFFLVVTDGRLYFSIPAAFSILAVLRLLTRLLPDKPHIRRREQLARIQKLLRSWALMDESQAVDQIRLLLPDLYDQSVWPVVRLVQKLPTGPSLSANELIVLKRQYQKSDTLHLLCTCAISSDAAALLPDFPNSCVQLTGSKELTRLLSKNPHILPVDSEKKKQRRPFSVCAAQFARSVRPLRSGMYMLAFLFIHQITRNRFYLISALLFALQLAAYGVSRFLSWRDTA